MSALIPWAQCKVSVALHYLVFSQRLMRRQSVRSKRKGNVGPSVESSGTGEAAFPGGCTLGALRLPEVWAVWLLEWGVRRPQKFNLDSDSTACSLFYCVRWRCEIGCCNLENGGGFVLIITDGAYRLAHYRLKLWMLIQKLAFGAFIHGCLCRGNDRRFCSWATLSHRVRDFFLMKVVLVWCFMGLSVLGRCCCLQLPKGFVT